MGSQAKVEGARQVLELLSPGTSLAETAEKYIIGQGGYIGDDPATELLGVNEVLEALVKAHPDKKIGSAPSVRKRIEKRLELLKPKTTKPKGVSTNGG